MSYAEEMRRKAGEYPGYEYERVLRQIEMAADKGELRTIFDRVDLSPPVVRRLAESGFGFADCVLPSSVWVTWNDEGAK